MQEKITSVQQLLMDAVMQIHNGDDTAANKALGWGKSRFNNYRFNRRCADDSAIVELAKIAGKDPEEAVRQHRAEQAKTPQMRQFWLQFGKAAACITIAVILSTFPAKEVQAAGIDNPQNFYYVKIVIGVTVEQGLRFICSVATSKLLLPISD